jgi:uncharacterized membrane protein YjjP (DUF1212 family)
MIVFLIFQQQTFDRKKHFHDKLYLIRIRQRKNGVYLLKNDDYQNILRTCLLAGKIMTESGSEIYRVEDTMTRIAKNSGIEKPESYVTLTGLFINIETFTQLENVRIREIHLAKVERVNSLSREYAQGKLRLDELYAALEKVDQAVFSFPYSLQLFSAGIVSATLMYIFGGTGADFLITFLIGAAGYAISTFTTRTLHVHYLNNFFAALAIGWLAYCAVHYHLGFQADTIIIGAVMPLVPGVPITNAFRDVLAGHLIGGMARGMEAILIAASIGIGIAVAIKFFY